MRGAPFLRSVTKDYFVVLRCIDTHANGCPRRLQAVESGLAHLARLPRLREIHLSGLPRVTWAGTSVFPAHVLVDYDVFVSVAKLDRDPKTVQRLYEFGLLEGEQIEVVARAPLGDPIEIRVGNSRLSLRKAGARGLGRNLELALHEACSGKLTRHAAPFTAHRKAAQKA